MYLSDISSNMYLPRNFVTLDLILGKIVARDTTVYANTSASNLSYFWKATIFALFLASS